MPIVILGNLFSIVALIFSTISGTRKTKRDIIIYDMGAAASFTLCDAVLKGYSGVVQNIIGVCRNIVTLTLPNDKVIGWILVGCGVVFGFYFNNQGFVGMLPVVSCFFYSICMVNKKVSGRVLKLAFIINTFSFAIYSFVLLNYVGFLSDSFVGFTSLVSFIKQKEPTSIKKED